jgi:DNA (cytosine-5)-methyltransferase 1
MRKKINQLDLFSGIGGFHMGFERAGYKVKSYFSEIDKHAIAVYKHKFKDAEYVGSVTDVRGADLPKIDLITFGSPCQDFSLAGRRKGMDGERSSLILEAIRLIGECRPGVFVWENVKGTFSSNAGQDFAAILQAFANIGGYRLEWQLCNTANYLPQNRERIYLVGYSTSTKRDWKGIFPLPSNDGQDPQEWDKIREASKPIGHRGTGGQQGKVYSDQGHSPTISAYTSADPTFVKVGYDYATDIRGNEQTPTLRSSGTNAYNTQHNWDMVKVGNYIDGELEVYRRGDGKPLDPNIAPTITATEKSGGNHSDMAVLKVKSATKAGYEEATEGDSVSLVQQSSTRRGRVGKGTAQTLGTSCSQGVVQPVQIGQSSQTFAHKSGTLIGEDGQDAFTIRSSNPNGVKVDQPNYQIRRLTPIECERLQGFPDNHTAVGVYDGETKPISNTQRYKMCGNAVTVDVVHAIAKQITKIL